MIVIFQKIIKREDLRRNPDVLYVFGDNVMRRGMGGQAAEMRYEKNGVGVATKNQPHNGTSAFFGNEPVNVIVQNRIIDEDMKRLFAQVNQGGIVVWPADGIGTGLSRLPEFAPSTFEHLEAKMAALVRVGLLFNSGKLDDAHHMAERHIRSADEALRVETLKKQGP